MSSGEAVRTRRAETPRSVRGHVGCVLSTLTVVAPRLQEGWCLCEGEGEGELSGLFEALSMSGTGTESGQAEGQGQEQGYAEG